MSGVVEAAHIVASHRFYVTFACDCIGIAGIITVGSIMMSIVSSDAHYSEADRSYGTRDAG